MNDQITELQMIQMEHESSIGSLSEQLHRQQARIERMEKQLEALIDLIKQLKESLPPTEPHNTSPPHY